MRSVPARLAAFATALLVVFGLALGVGRVTAGDGPAPSPEPMADDGGGDHQMDEMEDDS